MYNRKMAGRMKRTLAGLLAAGLVLTGMPMPVVEAANETLEEQQAGTVEPVSDADKPIGEEGSSDAGQQGEAENVSDNNASGEEDGAEQDSENHGSIDQPESETPQPGTEDANEAETDSDEEEVVIEEDVPAEASLYDVQVSGNDISGNDLLPYSEEEEEGYHFVEGYIELPEERNISVVDESLLMDADEDGISFSYEQQTPPSQYIPGSDKLPLTRNQDPYGSCWAHSAMALAEIDMMNNNGAAPDIDYSELHLAYFSYHGEVEDPLGGLKGDSNSCTGSEFLNQGGSLELAQNVLTCWIGAADEETAPYKNASNELVLPSEIAFNDVAHLQNYYNVNIKENQNIAKQMIMEYGGLGTSYYEDVNEGNKNYNSDTNSYYCNDKKSTNHAVTIVGWDDSFKASNFNVNPGKDGAWLIRNSWNAGQDISNRGHDTYFWLSYEDTSLSGGFAFDFENADNYDHNYQYDGGMATNAWGAGTELASSDFILPVANVFTAQATEELKAVGIGVYKANTPYTISIYKNPDLTNQMTGDLIEGATTSGMGTCEGFYTVPLKEPVSLTKGDTFAVVVKFGVPKGDTMAYAACEYPINDSAYDCKVSAVAGQSFYYLNRAWTDYGVSNKCNFRIKAYTVDQNEGPDTPETYTVTFDVQGHGKAPESYADVKAGETIAEPKAPEEEGFVFDGWYQDSACTQKWNFETDTVSANLTLYAKWLKKDVPLQDDYVSFTEDLTGGLLYNGKEQTPAVTVKLSDDKLLKKDTDYTISYTNNRNAGEATATVTVKGIGSYSGTVTKNFTINKAPLTIQAKSYAITVGDPMPTYDYKCGQLMPDDTVTTPPTYTCKVTDSGKAGTYDIEPSGAKIGRDGKDEDNYIITYQKGTLTIKEKAAVTYTVTFDMQGHGQAQAPADYTNIAPGSTIERPAEPSEDGYVFGGWHRDKACTTPWNFVTDTVTENLTLYAKWLVSLKGATVSVGPDGTGKITYNGYAQEPEVSVAVSGTALVKGTDYTVSYSDNRNAGTAAVTVAGSGKYGGTVTINFTINKAPLKMKADDIMIRVGDPLPKESDYKYSLEKGELLGSDELVQEPSFSCTAVNSGTAGKYEIYLSGAKVGRDGKEEDNYDITFEKGVLIIAEKSAASLENAEISFADAGQSFTYDGTEHRPAVTVKVSGKELVRGTDYTLSYEDNKNAGTAKVVVTGRGGYSGTASKSFSIQKAKLTMKADDIVIRVGDPLPKENDYKYRLVEGELFGSDKLVREPSYTCDAKDSSAAGEYQITISGADAGSNYAISYAGGILKIVENAVFYTVTFDVQGHGTAPAELKNILEGSTVAKPEEDPAAAGYDFGGWYKDAACTEAWDFDTDKVDADLTLYAKWTAREAFSLEDAELFFENAMQRFTYDGTEQKPRVTVKVSGKELVEGADYTLFYVNNKNAGTATVLATGIGACYGAVGRIFEIQKAPLTVWAYDYSIRVNDPVPGAGDYAYGVDGLMPGESLVTAPVLTCAITDTASAGDYDIVPSGADAGENYRISYKNGKLTVVSEYASFTVAFDMQGHGIAPASYVVSGGSTIAMPPEPSVGGYRFGGWYRDRACTQAWEFETDIVQENLTLYAKWLKVVSSAAGENFAIQEIADIYYTGKPCRPAVSVYDGKTLLKAGRDYQIKYYNNTEANIGGEGKTGNGTGTDFAQGLPYVEIIGKGNYTAVAKVNFNILRVPIGDGGESPAAGVKLVVKDQLVTAAGGYLNPFSSIKYVKAMRQNTDYTVSLRAEDAKNPSGTAVMGEMGGAVIPAGYSGKFLLTVTGQGNYEGSICKPIYVADKGHLLKNAVVKLGKNQKNVMFTGRAVELAAAEIGSDDAFTVKCGGTVLKPGQDYTVGYRGNDRVGRAELIITGTGEYVGSKTVAFQIKGAPFTTKTVNVSGIEDRVYSGKAWTLDNVVLTDTAANKRLRYGTDYTASYSKNVNQGTASVTFTGIGEAGYSGSFRKTFKITAADIGQTTLAEDMQPLVFDYCKAGVEPVDEIVLIGANGARLKNGRDYTLQYANNKDVADADGANAPTVIVKGRGNYTGERRIPFQIVKADLAEMTVKTTPVAYKSNKPSGYTYKPTIKLMDGRTALREGKDYLITYRNNTQEDCGKYIQQENTAVSGVLPPADGVPMAVITANPESSYRLGEPIVIPLPVYREQFKKAEMDVAVGSSLYTGSQVRPPVKVSYRGRTLTEGVDYTVSYGPNVKSGGNRGSMTINGLSPAYGGSVTVKFGIARKDIAY